MAPRGVLEAGTVSVEVRAGAVATALAGLVAFQAPVPVLAGVACGPRPVPRGVVLTDALPRAGLALRARRRVEAGVVAQMGLALHVALGAVVRGRADVAVWAGPMPRGIALADAPSSAGLALGVWGRGEAEVVAELGFAVDRAVWTVVSRGAVPAQGTRPEATDGVRMAVTSVGDYTTAVRAAALPRRVKWTRNRQQQGRWLCSD